MNKIFSILITQWLCCVCYVNGQSFFVTGKVIDNATEEPIPFAHVFIAKTSFGTVTDLYGNFSLKVPDALANRSLQVSCLGYQSLAFRVNKSSTNFRIQLKEDIVELNEVVVKPIKARDLVIEALEKIPLNYDTTLSKLKGHFKLSYALNSDTISYVEAFLDLIKRPVGVDREEYAISGDSIWLREVRIKQKEIKDWKLKTILDDQNSPYYIAHQDQVYQLAYSKDYKKHFTNHYEFELIKMVHINNRSTYHISIIPKKNRRKAYWNGFIYIDEETKAFVKLDFHPSLKTFNRLRAGFKHLLFSRIYTFKPDTGGWKESVNYALENGKWYMKEVNISKELIISSNKMELEETQVSINKQYRSDTAISNIQFDNSLDYLPHIHGDSWQEIEAYIEARYDSTFWKEFDKRHKIEF